jgi:hypothetical protein
MAILDGKLRAMGSGWGSWRGYGSRSGTRVRAGVVTLLGLLVLGMSACGAGGSGAGSPTISTTAVPVTPTQPAPTATPTTAPTGTWTTIQAFTGSGNYQSARFQVTSPWRLVWQCNLSMGNPGPYPLTVDVVPSAGSGSNVGVINTVCKTGNTSGTSAEQTTPTGLVYLNVSSTADGEWDVRVQVLRP